MDNLLAAIQNQDFAPIYVFVGTDAYLTQYAKDLVLHQIVPLEEADLNVLTYTLPEASLEMVIEEANSFPFMGERKLVVVDNALFLTGDRTKTNEVKSELLDAYMADPNPSTVLCLFVPYESLDARKKTVKTLKQVATIIDVSPMEEGKLIAFIQQAVSREGYSIDKPALMALLHKTNANLALIMQELQKLYALTLESKHIGQEEVEASVIQSLESNVFALTDQLLKKDAARALATYRDLTLQREEPIKLLAILASQFRLLLQTSILQAKGYSQSDMASYLKVHPYRVKLALQQAKGFSRKRLEVAHRQVIEADYQLKSSYLDKSLVMELLILKIIAGD